MLLNGCTCNSPARYDIQLWTSVGIPWIGWQQCTCSSFPLERSVCEWVCDQVILYSVRSVTQGHFIVVYNKLLFMMMMISSLSADWTNNLAIAVRRTEQLKLNVVEHRTYWVWQRGRMLCMMTTWLVVSRAGRFRWRCSCSDAVTMF